MRVVGLPGTSAARTPDFVSARISANLFIRQSHPQLPVMIRPASVVLGVFELSLRNAFRASRYFSRRRSRRRASAAALHHFATSSESASNKRQAWQAANRLAAG